MKSKFLKALSILLSIMMIFSVCSVVAYADTETVPSYYVKAGGTGDGRTAETPAKTVASAIASMNADGYDADDTVNIYLIQDTSNGTMGENSYHMYPSWRDSAAGEAQPTYTAKIVVQPYDTSVNTVLAESATQGAIHPKITLGGPTVFDNIGIVTVRNSYNIAAMDVNGQDFTWTRNSNYNYYYMNSSGVISNAWGLPICTSYNGTFDNDFTVNVNGKLHYGTMYIGYPASYGDVTYNGNVTLVLNNNDIGSHSQVPGAWVSTANQNITFAKNLNVVVKDVSEIGFSSAGKGTLTVGGGVQYMVAPGETVTHPLTDLTCFAEGTKFWTINPATKAIMEKISFTDVAGTYAVTEGLKATNADGDVYIYDEETMTLTVPAGEWTIETYHAPMTVNYYVKSGGTGDGKTPETPAASVIDVVNTINADGLVSGDTANVYLMQDALVMPGDNTHNMSVWGVSGGQPAAHTALLNILPYSGNEGHAYLAHSATCGAINQVMNLNGPTKFDNIYIVSNRWSYNHEIYLCGNDATFGPGINFGQVGSGATSVTWDYNMRVVVNGWQYNNGPYDKEVNITYQVPTQTNPGFMFGNAYERSGSTTFNEDVNITFDQANLGSHSSMSYPVTIATKNYTVNFEKNLNFKVLQAQDIQFGGAGVANVNGAVQLITNTSTTYPNAEIYNCSAFAEGTKFYKLIADANIIGNIEFTATAGTYNITDGKHAMAIDAEGTVIVSDNGVLTVPEGTWNVSVYVPPKTVEFFVKNGGTGDGTSRENPAASVASVMAAVKAANLTTSDTALITILEREDWNAAPVSNVHNMAYIADATNTSLTNVTPNVVIQGDPESETKVHLTALKSLTRHVEFGESLTFRNLVLVSGDSTSLTYYLNGGNAVFESDVEFAMVSSSWAGGTIGESYANISTNKYVVNANYTSKQTIEMKAPMKKGQISIPGNNYNAGVTHSEDLNVILDNAQIGSGSAVNISFSGSHQGSFTTNFTKNVNINVKNATAVNFVNGANANGKQFINVAGGLQLILNTAVTYNTTDIGSIASITDTTPIYVLLNDTKNADIVDFTATAGTYKVTSENTVYAVDASGNEVYAEGGKLVLEPGTWTIMEKIPPKGVHYYVKYGGTGDGRTLETPAASVYAVTNAIAEDLTAQDIAYVNIIQSDTYNTAPEGGTGNYLTPWTGGTATAHTATMVVQGYDGTKPYLAYGNGAGLDNGGNVSIALYGPTVIQNVTLVATWGNNQRSIYANGYDITVEPTVGFSNLNAGFDGTNFGNSYGHVINAQAYNPGAKTYTDSQTITYKANTISDHVINVPSNNYCPTTSKEDLNIVIDGSNIGNINSLPIVFGSGHTYDITTTYEKNININVKSAKKVSFQSSAGADVVKANAIQAILNPDVTYNTTDIASLASIPDDTPIYVLNVYSEVEDALSFTATAGTYTVNIDGVDAIATAADGTKYQSDNGVLTVPAGEYDITFVEEQTNDFGDYINKRGSDLQNTYSKLVNDKELKVVYFGGSVTNGYGINAGEDCWRTMIGSWLQNSFPDAAITNVNKACGESGTYLGSYRLTRDILSEKPDLLFLEYSINDKYDYASYAKSSYQYETIVRQVKEELPDCDIVTILVTDSGAVSAAYKANGGNLHTQAQAHEDMAKIYNIPTLHVGRRLADKMLGQWSAEVSIDSVHLTEYGNELYYDVIHEYFANELIHGDYDGTAAPEYVMPELQNEHLLDGNITYIEPSQALVDRSEELGGTGITYAHAPEFTTPGYDEIFNIRYNNNSEKILAIEFEGTELIGLFHNYSSSETFQISIDGGEYETKNFYHMNPTTFVTGLESGKHVARIKFTVTESRAWTWLGAIFSRDAEVQTAKQYGLTVDGGNAYTKLSGEAVAATAGKDVTVTLNANVPVGSVFAGWEVVSGSVTLADASAETTTFKMVGEAVEVKANYEVLGDADGVTNVLDLVRLKKYLAGAIDAIGNYADYDKDGAIDTADLVTLRKIIIGAIEAPTSGAITVTEDATINEVIDLTGTDATDAVVAESGVATIEGGSYNGGQTVLGGAGNTAVWANGGDVVINDGTFTVAGLAEGDTGHIDLIYASVGTITINGGFFYGADDTVWLLNCKDANYNNGTANIVVTGGTFVNFNPADNASEGAGTSFVAEGYTVVAETQENGDVWYTVVAE